MKIFLTATNGSTKITEWDKKRYALLLFFLFTVSLSFNCFFFLSISTQGKKEEKMKLTMTATDSLNETGSNEKVSLFLLLFFLKFFSFGSNYCSALSPHPP